MWLPIVRTLYCNDYENIVYTSHRVTQAIQKLNDCFDAVFNKTFFGKNNCWLTSRRANHAFSLTIFIFKASQAHFFSFYLIAFLSSLLFYPLFNVLVTLFRTIYVICLLLPLYDCFNTNAHAHTDISKPLLGLLLGLPKTAFVISCFNKLPSHYTE